LAAAGSSAVFGTLAHPATSAASTAAISRLVFIE
jgi:hypothetical protein